jgi:fatty-acyl-CoA synthase
MEVVNMPYATESVREKFDINEGVFKAGELAEITIGDLLDAQAERYADRDGLISPYRNLRLSYAQLRDEVNRVARGLMAIGVKKGDHVAIWAYNYPQWIYTMFATAKIGAILITVNTNYKTFELEYLLRQSDAMTIIMMEGTKDNNYLEHIYSVCPELHECEPGKLQCKKLPYLKNVVFLSEDGSRHDGMFNWDDMTELAENVSESERAALQASLHWSDVINMQYTSGTTGFPKGVMLTHYNLVNNGRFIGDGMNFTEQDRLLVCVPMFHCFGYTLSIMAAITHGSANILLDYYNPIKVMETVQNERCTALNGVPTMFIAMLGHERFDEFDFSTLRTGIMAGSLCPIQTMRQVVERMNMRELVIVFGQTECSPGMTMSRTDDPLELRVTTVGRLLPHCEGKIIDPETGKEQPPNTPGELVTRGYHVMKGYYKMPEATKVAVDADGWLHTGDIGEVDENGYYKITGRLKDMIIRGGENIYPREIEEFLYTHNAISDVQVVGVPDEKYGEEVIAFCILNRGASATEEELIEFVRNGLSKYKAPRYIRFTESFPMTASGKIQKFKLREQAIAELGREDVYKVDVT